ncbi:MAG: methylmalonyl Co-A mutase-associated GTPase MeaB [Bacteriovoracaceae bacterium]|nr:methylmalonyl Co-A mutase-associated GTPase MeaB [Bacteriovoracaceae bacterium]
MSDTKDKKNKSRPNLKRPEWAPKDAGNEFASNVMEGVTGGHDGMPGSPGFTSAVKRTPVKRIVLSTQDYIDGILAGNRTILARAITLIESNAVKHQKIARDVLTQLLPYAGKSLRIGFTGVPGAGKSSTIETLGHHLCEKGFKVAVLAVDPSSTVTRGSVLGDKTRMEKVSNHKNAFVRPSPSSGTLGGVTRKTRETILLCEAFGFETIFIETVGVGQSETSVRSMVDFFLLILVGGAGDELQGIKKGVVELADAIAINKADGDNIHRAGLARLEYSKALHYLTPVSEGWRPDAYTISALTGDGIDELWGIIKDFETQLKSSGAFDKRRSIQRLEWVMSMVESELIDRFYNSSEVASIFPDIKEKILGGEVVAAEAAETLLDKFYK